MPIPRITAYTCGARLSPATCAIKKKILTTLSYSRSLDCYLRATVFCAKRSKLARLKSL